MFSFIKNSLQGIYNQFTAKISSFFSRTTIDEAAFQELEHILIISDVGIKTTQHIMQGLRSKKIQDGKALHQAMHEILYNLIAKVPIPIINQAPAVFLMVGINGSGKTTTIGKLAHWWAGQGKKVLVVAADTFRAAAVAQLEEWSKKSPVTFFAGSAKEPAAVVYEGCEQFLLGNYDILLIDTAGRLQTKIPLMHELSKIKRIIAKKIENIPVHTILTLDGMLGQNSFEQARLFKEATSVSGIVLTKMDGTGKGGIIFSVLSELAIPILYITYGEKIQDIAMFDGQQYVQELLQKGVIMEQVALKTLVDQLFTLLMPVYKDQAVAKRHAWWTLESIFNKKQAELLTQEIITINAAEKKSMDEWVRRITEHNEPIQYIIGTVPFGNLVLDVEHPVLIPRPETEEWVHNFIQACKDKGLEKQPFSILDVGTGSGCIAITLAHHLPLATVIAVDNNSLAVALAKKNVKKHALTNVHIVESDLFNNIPADIQFDVIVSNPPYISIEDFFTLEPSVTAWEDCNALVAEDDGFLYLETIAKEATSRLKKEAHHDVFPARLVLEIGHEQAERMIVYVKDIGFQKVDVKKDSFGKNRVIVATL